jgi:hypothetical protein
MTELGRPIYPNQSPCSPPIRVSSSLSPSQCRQLYL